MVETGGSPEKSGRDLPWVSSSNAREIYDDAESYVHDEFVELATDELALDELATDEGSGEDSDEGPDEATTGARLREALSISSVETLIESPVHHAQLPNGFEDAMTLDFDALSRFRRAEYERLRVACDSSPERTSQRPILSLFAEHSGRGRSQSAQLDQAASFPRFEIDDLSPENFQSDRDSQPAPSLYAFEHYSPTEVSALEFSHLNGPRANIPSRRPIAHQKNRSIILGLSSSLSSSPISFSTTGTSSQNPRQLNDVNLSPPESLRNPVQVRQHLLSLNSTDYPGELVGGSSNPRYTFPPRASIPYPWQIPGQPAAVPSVDRRRGQSLSGTTQSTDRILQAQVNHGGLTASRSMYFLPQV